MAKEEGDAPMIHSSLSVKTKIPQPIKAKGMEPIPREGIGNLIRIERGKGTVISVALIVCRTRYGRVNEPVTEICLVKHVKGGPHMLPQGEYEPSDTPHKAAKSLLMNELKIPESELMFVNGSCVLVGSNIHRIPRKRVKTVSLVGSEVDKMLVFVMACVNEPFVVGKSATIKKMTWVTNLKDARALMKGMRSPEKYRAELLAIQSVTGWK